MPIRQRHPARLPLHMQDDELDSESDELKGDEKELDIAGRLGWMFRNLSFVHLQSLLRLQGRRFGILVVIIIFVSFLIRRDHLPPTIASIPLPKDFRASVVLMNHNRPRMVKGSKLLPVLTAHPLIDEVILCHSNPTTAFEYQHTKVRNVNATEANAEFGLALRFHYCRGAANQAVIHVDDDMEMTLDAITDLLQSWYATNHQRRDGTEDNNTLATRIVGKYGRGYSFWKAPSRNGYVTRTLSGPVEVVLTKIMVVDRELCHSFFDYSSLVADLLPKSHPLWNGEDIFMSLVANAVNDQKEQRDGHPATGYSNYALSSLDVWEAGDDLKDDDTGQHDVSGNMDRHRIWKVGFFAWWNASCKAQAHAAYRGYLWSTARQRLQQETRHKAEIALLQAADTPAIGDTPMKIAK